MKWQGRAQTANMIDLRNSTTLQINYDVDTWVFVKGAGTVVIHLDGSLSGSGDSFTIEPLVKDLSNIQTDYGASIQLTDAQISTIMTIVNSWAVVNPPGAIVRSDNSTILALCQRLVASAH